MCICLYKSYNLDNFIEVLSLTDFLVDPVSVLEVISCASSEQNISRSTAQVITEEAAQGCLKCYISVITKLELIIFFFTYY